MKLRVTRFAPPGVNRATPGYLKNMGPHGAHLILLHTCLEATGKCHLFMESIYSSNMSIDLPIFHIEMHNKSQRLYSMTIPHSQLQEYLSTFIMNILLAYSILKMTF